MRTDFRFFALAKEFFQFKQFRVWQDRSAMKVCTESCVFGGLIEVENDGRTLDVGTGTGLLSLMLAQKSNLPIDAVEMDLDSFEQARLNFERSPWHANLNAIHMDIVDFARTTDARYDLIVSNPPFFRQFTKSPSVRVNRSRHVSELSFNILVDCVSRLLNPLGVFFVLLPTWEINRFVDDAHTKGLVLKQVINLYDQSERDVFRQVLKFKKSEESSSQIGWHSLVFKETDGLTYTSSFRNLLKDFYIIF